MKKVLEYVKIYLGNEEIRRSVSLLFGLVLSALYVILNLFFGILYGDPWFVTVAIYNILMFSLRSMIVSDTEGNTRAVGEVMIITDLSLTGLIAYTVIVGRKHDYPLFLIVVFGAHAVFGVFRAVRGLIANSREKSGKNRCIYMIRLTETLLSLFNFQSSIVAFFSHNRTFNLIIGFSLGSLAAVSSFKMAKALLEES